MTAAFTILAGLCLAADATSVALRPVVRGLDGGPVLLGEVAEIHGPARARLEMMELAPSPAALPRDPSDPGWARLDATIVRAALARCDDLHGGEIVFTGSRAEVRVPGHDALPRPSVPRHAAPVARHALSDEAPRPRDEVAEAAPKEFPAGSIGAHIRTTLRGLLGVAEGDLRVWFEPDDEALLTEPVRGRQVHAAPTAFGERTPVNLTIYDGERIARTAQVRTRVMVRRDAALATRPIARGERVEAADVRVGPTWVSPDRDPAEPAGAIGSAASRRIGAGTVIEAQDVRPAAVIRRGEMVVVHSVAGSVVVRRQMRALDDAAQGDRVWLETVERDRRVEATAAGRGQAVLRGAGEEGLP